MKQIDFLALALCAAAAAVIGYQAASHLSEAPTQPQAIPTPYYVVAPDQPTVTPFPSTPPATAAPTRKISLKLPAVTSTNKGILAELTVTAKPGTGQVFISFSDSNPIIMNDTQVSIRTAIEAAKQATGITSLNETNQDYFFTINTPSEAVSGKSAGAATAIALMALLEGSNLRNDTLITGTIQPDGRIGPVGKILFKAQAAKEAGYSTLLVPPGESTTKISRTIENRSCTKEFIPNEKKPYEKCVVSTYEVVEEANISQAIGINVLEVSNITQAYALFKED
ncbi:MAG: S16 family serine protease [Candidatus Micrarchaeia archaeon]